MVIQFICPNGHELSAPEDRAGKPGKCPKCQTEFLVPELDDEGEANDAIEVGSGISGTIVFLCPNGHRLNGPASLKGKPGQCPHCGARFRIPADDDEDEDDSPPVDAIPATPPTPVSPAPVSAAQNVPAPGPPVTKPASRSKISRSTAKPPVFSSDFLSTVTPADDEIVEMTGTDDQVNVPMADSNPVVEPVGPPSSPLEHPLHPLVGWLFQQRSDKQPILIRLKDGEVLEIDHFAPELSRGSFAMFASREANDRFSLITIPWNDIARVDLHKVKSLSDDLFF